MWYCSLSSLPKYWIRQTTRQTTNWQRQFELSPSGNIQRAVWYVLHHQMRQTVAMWKCLRVMQSTAAFCFPFRAQHVEIRHEWRCPQSTDPHGSTILAQQGRAWPQPIFLVPWTASGLEKIVLPPGNSMGSNVESWNAWKQLPVYTAAWISVLCWCCENCSGGFLFSLTVAHTGILLCRIPFLIWHIPMCMEQIRRTVHLCPEQSRKYSVKSSAKWKSNIIRLFWTALSDFDLTWHLPFF